MIKSGSYIDIFMHNKNKHSGGVSCSACNAFIWILLSFAKILKISSDRLELLPSVLYTVVNMNYVVYVLSNFGAI